MTYTFGQASTNKVGAVGGEQPEAQTPRYTFGQASGSIQQAAPVEEKTLGRKTAEVLAPSTTNLSDYVRASTRLKSGEVANIQKEREAVQAGITQMEQMLPSRPDLAQSIAESKQRIAEIDKDVAGVVSKADKTTGQKVGMALGTGLELGSLPELASLGLGKAFGTASTKKVLEIAPKNKIVQAITKATTVAPKTAQQDLAYKLAPLSGKAKTIAKETAKVLPETLALGYGYDVSTGLQDKAEQPFAPGAGTVMGASIPVAIGTGRLVKNAMFKPAEKKIADIITRRERELYNIENNYSLLRKNMNFSKDANAASRRRIASTDILANAVDDTGTIRTTNPGGPVDQYRDQVLHGSEAIVRKNLEREGAYTTPDVIRKKIEKVIGDSRLTMDEKETAFSGIDKILTGFQRQYPDGKIPLVAIQDEKVNAGALAYRNLDPAIKTRLKALTRAYKEVLEESSNLNVKEMNDELAKYLKDISLLESLDGRKVKGGKLGKYFAQISGNLIGGATGSAIGGVPGAAIGTVVGGELASRIKGTALSRTLAGETGQVGVKSPVLKEAQQKATSPRLQLPAPKFGRDYVQSNKSGNLNQRYADTAMTSNSGNINNSLPLTADKASAGDKLKKLLRQSPRGMVDLNAEIFPKKPAALKNPLLEEAKKYKSAEEFVQRTISQETGFKDSHVAPGFDNTPVKKKMDTGGDFSLKEVANGYSNQPSDYFDPKVGARYYGYDNLAGRQSETAINNIIRAEKNGITDRTITAYRTVPKDTKVTSLENGEWVTFSKEYAKQHGLHRFDDKYKIIEQEVKPTEVWWDGNDINEWGFDNGKGGGRKTQMAREKELTDIWNRANKNNSDDALINEAKKYKSADEFVNRHTDSNKASSIKDELSDKWYTEVFLPNEKDFNSVTTDIIKTSKDESSIKKLFNAYKGKEGYSIVKTKEAVNGMENTSFGKSEWGIQRVQNDTDLNKVNKARDLYIKSQLTDIWNKAKGTTKTTLPVYKGETDLTTGDNLSYAHLKDDTLRLYKDWSEQKKDLKNIK